jgi:hypothetical protein
MLPQPDPHTASDRQMCVRDRNSLFQVFPNELVSTILAMLEYRDLVSCMQVRGVPFVRFLLRIIPLPVLTLAGVQTHA